LVVIRPPLVYGPGVGANFRALMGLVARGVPLPFAAIDNRRSLIFIDNLTDLIAVAAQHRDAAGPVLLARDSTDVSTPELIRALAAALDVPARLFPLPGIGSLVPALAQSAEIDDSGTRTRLDWAPPVTTEEGLAATAASFRAARALYR
jgi:nucleoside-diphosphate-sugar epimerase